MGKRLFANLLLVGAMGLGILTGWGDVPFLNSTADVASDLFLRLLKLISLPIIFLSITSTITGMNDIQEMRRMGRRILIYTLGTTIVAAAVALVLFVLIDPAGGLAPVVGEEGTNIAKQGSYLSFALNMIPSNLFGAFIENNVIGIAFIGLLISCATLFLPDEQREFLHKLFSALFAVMIKITTGVIKLMPIAIWAFMVLLVRDLKQNHAEFSRLVLYLACVVGANVIQGVVILPLFLKLKKISPLRVFRAMSPALTLAFFSKSSSATLPVTLRSAQDTLGVSKKVSNFSLPLCSVINMNGCAAFILTTVLFVSMINGITFSGIALVGWIFFATIAAIGNAGVPMGCFFLASAFLIGMDVPLYMMGLILPFYAILDMIETALNVWSDACVTVAVDHDLKPVEEVVAQEA